jgi:uncharacterized protein (TIGR02270 family)
MLTILESIVVQHVEEADFLWVRRKGVIGAANYDLKDLANYDNRIEAHIDGLRVSGEPGWQICKEALNEEEPGEVFAASVLAFEGGQLEWIDAVLEVGSKSFELSRGMISALGWLPFEQASDHVQKLLSEESPVLKRMGLAASSIHRQDPGALLGDFLDTDDALLQARTLKAAGELRRQDLLEKVKACFTSEDLACRFWAAWAGALLGERAALPALQQLALEPSPFQERACALALRGLGTKAALDWHRELIARPDLHRLAVQGVGVIGDPILLPWVFEQMAIPETARVAGESFSMITGLDLEFENYEGEWPKGFEAGTTDNPEDEDVAMDPDEDLPWPNVELLEKWWHKHKKDFQKGTRYLCGEPMSIGSLNRILRNGYQRQRMAAALELAIHQPDTPLFETRAPGFVQQRLLGNG